VPNRSTRYHIRQWQGWMLQLYRDSLPDLVTHPGTNRAQRRATPRR